MADLEQLEALRVKLVAQREWLSESIGTLCEMMDNMRRADGMSEMDIQVISARRIMETWPEWKRNILTTSGKPTMDQPRMPVDNLAVKDCEEHDWEENFGDHAQGAN